MAIQSYEKDTKLTVLNILESESLACAYYIRDGDLCNELLKKKDNQWSIARNGSLLSRKTKVSQTGYTIYINSNQNQYYVIVTKWNSDVNTPPSDSLNSIYQEYYNPEISDLHYWFVVIGEKPDEYWIDVGGERIQIFE